MNDKTEQSLTDEPCGTAAGGHAVIINVPGCPLMVRAVDYNTLRAQLAEAQRDAERYRWIESQTRFKCGRVREGRINGRLRWDIEWGFDDEEESSYSSLGDAIDAAKGEPS